MKRKGTSKILIVVVVLIWGVLGFQLWDSFSGDQDTSVQTNTIGYKKPVYNKREKFDLIPSDRDPFLGTLYRKSKASTGSKSKTQKEEIQWPTINYVGIVSDTQAKSPIFIVSINGTQHLLSRGEQVTEIQLVKGSAEQVTLVYKGVRKQFSKTQ